MTRLLNTVSVFVLLALSALPTFATVLPKSSVAQIDPYIATLSVRLLRASSVPKLSSLAGLPGRTRLPVFGDKAKLEFAFFRGASPTSPLVFVVPGLGGMPNDGAAQYVGDILKHVGDNVAVLTNPFSWKFVLARSVDAVPGYIPEEAQQLAKMMNDVRSQLASAGVHPSSVSAVGYSLGAVHLGFLELAEKAGTLKNPVGLKRVVMINPPLDMEYALTQLDRLENIRDRLSKNQQDNIWGNILSKSDSISAPKKNENLVTYLQGAIKTLNVTRSQAAFLIGESFRTSLTELIVASQTVHDRGLLKEPISEYHRNARISEASGIIYGKYMNEFMKPFWEKKEGTNFDTSNFVAQASLVKFKSQLAQMPEIRLIHNADDFLTNADDLTALDAALGQRSMVFPYGGHIGNLWAPNVQRAIVGALQ
jgi:hypothetical protein